MFSKVVLALAMLAGSASALLYTSHPESQKYMWEQFKQEYSKNYATMEEETQRFGFFVDNLKLADERNSADSATYGITKFRTCLRRSLSAPTLPTSHAPWRTAPGTWLRPSLRACRP